MASRTYKSRIETTFFALLMGTSLVVVSGCAPESTNEPEPILGTALHVLPIQPSPFPHPSKCSEAIGLPGLPLLSKHVTSKYGDGMGDAALGDMDGDGDLDVVISSYYIEALWGEKGALGVYRNNGNGTFGAGAVTWSLNARYHDELTVADMNNDGYLDVIQAGWGGPAIVMLNNGQGAMGSSFVLPSSPADGHKFVITDLNNDGFNDVVLRAQANNNELHVAINNGGTAFGVYNKTTFPAFADFAVADVHGDGKGDLVLALSASNTVQVRSGVGNATFGLPVDYPSVNGVNTVGLRDLNGDGRVDLVASNGTATEVRLSTGNGTFAAPVTYTGGSADIADLNGDGILDLAGSITLFNNGNGTFTSQTIDYVPHQDASFGDINLDGLADIARVDGAEGVSLLFNQGNGGFIRPYVQLNVKFATVQQVASVDVTGDDLNDLVIVGSGNTPGLHVNLGNGNYAPPVNIPATSGASVIETADMNGDGHNDLVTANGSMVGVWLNNGLGAFPSGVTYPVAAVPDMQIAVGDLNGDGALDVARVASSTQVPNTSTLSVMYNQGAGMLGPSIDVGVGNAVPIDLFAVDTDSDGDMDLTVYGQQSIVQTFQNNGGGGFTNLNPNPIPNDSVYVTSFGFTDVNDDGYADRFASHQSDASGSSSSTAYLTMNNGNGTYSPGPFVTWGDHKGRAVGAAHVDRNGFKDLFVLRGNNTFVVYMNSGTTFSSKKSYLTSADGMLVTDVDGDGVSELITTTGALHKIKCYP